MRIRGICAALAALLALLPLPSAGAHSRDDVRARYAAVSDWAEGTPYAAEPSVAAPYAQGNLRAEALTDALNYMNFLRWLAGLEPVELDARLTDIAQCGAVLQAANDCVSHEPGRPADMAEDFYEKARYAAESSSIARLNWRSDGALREAVKFFARDDGDANLPTLGHRRWLLNPRMAATGLGLAASAAGNSYALLYAHDLQAEPGDWTHVAWPAAGAFPAELIAPELAWSIVLNPQVYASWDGARVTLTDITTGEIYRFPGDGGFFAVDEGGYGAGPCLIFRPDVGEDYQQNRRFRVDVEGISGPAISYAVEMISLYSVDVASVEVEPRALALTVGESAGLSAAVVPAWADDLTVVWSVSDAAVARVEDGRVTALAAGECQIAAVAANGQSDTCALRVY